MSGSRKLGPALATVLVAGNMIGSGVFLLPATLAHLGGITLFGWLFATLGALVLALVFARQAQRDPLTGGPASTVYAAFGPFAGFQASLSYWASCLIGNVAIAAAAAGYLAALVPSLSDGARLAAASVAVLWVVTAVNWVSPRFVAQLDGLLFFAGLVPLLAIGSLGWLAFDGALYREAWNPTGQPWLRVVPSSLVLVFWAFTGLESASVAAAVVREPKRNVPIATLAGVAIAAAVYISATSVIMGLVPARELAASPAPFALAAQRALGMGLGPLIAVAAMLKSLATLAGFVLVTAQVSLAAAERGQLPRAFARLRQGDIPEVGLLAAALVGTLAAALSVSPTLGQQFGVLIEVSTLFALLTYAGACLAAVRRGAALDRALGAIGAVLCAAMAAGSSARMLGLTAAFLALFALAFTVARLARR